MTRTGGEAVQQQTEGMSNSPITGLTSLPAIQVGNARGPLVIPEPQPVTPGSLGPQMLEFLELYFLLSTYLVADRRQVTVKSTSD